MSPRRLTWLISSSPLWRSSLDEKEELSRTTGLDLAWYFRRYFDALGPSWDAADLVNDYRDNVRRLARSPNMAFDEAWYRQEYPAVDELVKGGKLESGWEHYVLQGANDFHNPNTWFDEKWYQQRYGEVAAAVKSGALSCGFEHFVLYGIRQDFAPSMLFNACWYRQQYYSRDQRERYPVVDYLSTKPKLRPCPTPLFDPAWYSTQYLSRTESPDKQYNFSAFEHYLLMGRRLGYSPSVHFNELAYRQSYKEAEAAVESGRYKSGLEHFISEGALNGNVALSHLKQAGVDYAAPPFLEAYQRSVALNIRQIAGIRDVAEQG